ncbi:ferric iron uptake transcriptional regulator [Duodenibacillus massiliensis]|uniref:ferric iron uptake transcriptional regulator n=1 Tax=Duodenibacillus massiliensis TaxID=1852381 RepID=UPI003AB8D3B0
MAMTYGIREPEEELKTAGLKATAPRMKILEIFQRAQQNPEERHLSAEDVYKQLLKENLDAGLATVYRVLTQFEAAGILVRHHFGSDRATYEMDDGDHHDHIVCTRCGRVEEFVDREIERRQRQVAEKMGFTMESHSLSMYGICAECKAKEEEKAKKKAGL